MNVIRKVFSVIGILVCVAYCVAILIAFFDMIGSM